MAAITVQAINTTKGGVQRRRFKKQARGYQVLHRPGGPDRGTKEKYEVLLDELGPTKHDPGLPMVRGNAAKHRLGSRMARLRPTTSSSEDAKCSQSAVRVTNQEPPVPLKEDRTAHPGGLHLVPGKTSDNGLKASRAVYGPKHTTYPGRIQTTLSGVRGGRIPMIPGTKNLGSCDRTEARSAGYHSRQNICPDSNQTESAGRVRPRTFVEGVHSPFKKPLRVTILLH